MAVTQKEFEAAEIVIELQGVYDGWSIAVMKDGTLRNRWSDLEGYERRADQTQAVIDEIEATRAATGEVPWEITKEKE